MLGERSLLLFSVLFPAFTVGFGVGGGLGQASTRRIVWGELSTKERRQRSTAFCLACSCELATAAILRRDQRTSYEAVCEFQHVNYHQFHLCTSNFPRFRPTKVIRKGQGHFFLTV